MNIGNKGSDVSYLDSYPQVVEKIDWALLLTSGERAFVGSNAAVPSGLLDDLIARHGQLYDIELVHILTLSDCPWAAVENKALFKVNSLFIGAGVREAINQGYADYTPCFLSEIPSLFSEGVLPLDVAFIMVSPPDELGYCSFGVSVDVVSAAVKSAKKVVAQINPHMPRTCGHSFVHMDEIDCAVVMDVPLPTIEVPVLDKPDQIVGLLLRCIYTRG